MKTGLVDVGGGMRGIYAAGVLDFCLERHIAFDCCIGVSAGSANVASFLAGQKGRNFRYYTQYSLRKEYMGMGNFVRLHNYVNLQYSYGALSNSDGEDPLDYAAMRENPAQFLIVAEEAVSGKPHYFTKDDIRQDDYRVLMASSTLPGVNRPFEIGGTLYYDGALADPVPIEKAFAEGCERVVLILTKPVNVLRQPGKDPLFARWIRKSYPRSAQNLLKRAERYNASVARAKEYAKQGRLLLIAPENTEGVSTLSRNSADMERLYHRGYRDGEQILAWFA